MVFSKSRTRPRRSLDIFDSNISSQSDQFIYLRRGTEMEEVPESTSSFEFLKIILPGTSWEKMRMPDKFAKQLDGREPREVKLQVAGGGRRLWRVEAVFDGDGHMFLGRGWGQFSRAHDLRLGYLLRFRYDGGDVLNVKVFDCTLCRKDYPQHGDDDSGEDDGSDAAPSQFTVTLRECNLREKQNQYLNVPVEFQDAHGYEARSKVVLQMRGASWEVKLKHGKRPRAGEPRTWLRYGWHQFCVDNGLQVGDTCFFRVSGEDHVLTVEVRKQDGTFVR